MSVLPKQASAEVILLFQLERAEGLACCCCPAWFLLTSFVPALGVEMPP